jgi:hypothetical protein
MNDFKVCIFIEEVWQVALSGRLKEGVTGWEGKWRGRGRSNTTARVVSCKYTAAQVSAGPCEEMER